MNVVNVDRGMKVVDVELVVEVELVVVEGVKVADGVQAVDGVKMTCSAAVVQVPEHCMRECVQRRDVVVVRYVGVPGTPRDVVVVRCSGMRGTPMQVSKSAGLEKKGGLL